MASSGSGPPQSVAKAVIRQGTWSPGPSLFRITGLLWRKIRGANRRGRRDSNDPGEALVYGLRAAGCGLRER
jgi:hypothetical protein